MGLKRYERAILRHFHESTKNRGKQYAIHEATQNCCRLRESIHQAVIGESDGFRQGYAW